MSYVDHTAVMSIPSERMKGLTWREGRDKDRSTGTSRRRKAEHLIQREFTPAEGEARERLEMLAKRASFNLLCRLQQQLSDGGVVVALELHDLEGVIDVCTFFIEDANNWKGVLQWLDDTAR